MNFQPLTEEELQVADLLLDGSYSYQVIKSEDKISKAGNQYISATLKVWDEEGKERQIFTNFALVKLLKHFCDVNNMENEYKSGNIPAETLLNKCGGLVLIGKEGEKPNLSGGMYKAKNIVKDYIVELEIKHSGMKPLPAKSDDFLNDEIPFSNYQLRKIYV